ncbi:glycosyltransferase [Marivirga sp.]|uniref:glycosyltransferase n=1 Tax=Marivirga sp. TaxID=2018662 RepID=UPI0025E8F918|nr:glycosyltransferase [Marivirga sp.]
MDFTHIFYIALAKWDGQYASTAFSIAEEFSNRQKKVYYVENPLTLKDIFLNIHKNEIIRRLPALFLGIKSTYEIKENLIAVTPSAVLPINWMPRGNMYSLLSKFNNSLFQKSISKIIKEEKLRNYIIYNSFNPFYNFNSTASGRKLSIYQSVDDISQSEYIKKHGASLEKTYAKSADLILTTSSHLKKKLRKYNQNTHLVANAANVRLFNKALDENGSINKTESILDDYKAVIGYVGNICHRINYKLLLNIADRYPKYLLLMVGPVNANNPDLQKLKKYKNVFFTGSKKPTELIPYLRRMDCSIIPFLKNKLTKSIYPLKINEYLAAGLPVITTNFSEDIKSFKEVIYLSENEEEFVHHIQKAIAENTTTLIQNRTSFVAANNWENRTQQILEIIQNQA